MQSENAVHRVVNGVADARAIVEALLEDKIQEAGQLYMRVFGPDIPEKGYFFNGSNPIRDFVQQEVPDANFQNVRVQTYSNKFVDLGYTFVVSDGKAITIFSKIKPNFGKEAVASMEQSLGMTNQTPVTWNGKTEPAGQIIYGQPVHQTGTQKAVAATQGKNLTMTAAFGGLQAPTGSFTAVNQVNTKAVEKGLKSGFAYVLKYPNNSFAVITPPNFKFTTAAIQSLESNFGLKEGTVVNWYNNNVTHGKHFLARNVIYGQPLPNQKP